MLRVIQTYYKSLSFPLHYFTFINNAQDTKIITDTNDLFQNAKILLFGLSRLGYITDITYVHNLQNIGYIKTAIIPIFNDTKQFERVLEDIVDINDILTRHYDLLLHDPNTTNLRSKISKSNTTKIVSIVKDALVKNNLIF